MSNSSRPIPVPSAIISVADLLARQHPVEARAFHVQDLAAQRQHRLVAAVAPGLGRAAGAVALDQEKLGLRRILFRTILQLAGQKVHIHRRLAPRQFACLARRLAGQRGLDDLADDHLGLGGMLLEPLGQLLVHQALDRRAHLGTHQLVLGLRAELGIGHLDRQHAGQPLARVVAGQGDLFPARCRAESGRHRLIVRVSAPRNPAIWVPPSRCGMLLVKGRPSRDSCRSTTSRLDPDAVALAGHPDRLADQRCLRPVEIADEFAHAAIIAQLDRFGRARPFVGQRDPDAGIEEGKLAQPVSSVLNL
jgi:hypothetical protein